MENRTDDINIKNNKNYIYIETLYIHIGSPQGRFTKASEMGQHERVLSVIYLIIGLLTDGR